MLKKARETEDPLGPGFCRVHGAVEGPRDSRGRARCAIRTCRKILAIHAPTDLLPRADTGTSPDPGDSNDPQLKQLMKELRTAELQRKIREAEEPLRWERVGPEWDRRLSAVEAGLERLADPPRSSPFAWLDRFLQQAEEGQKLAERLSEIVEGTPLAGVRSK